ncbi:MAG: hypothetical protein NPINA01_22490 [Nitrospinaceae bacterium]|nr:MAG: hypothetical protein NPINA01_22490 [Nitrospinaceae bacterium]
MKEILEKPGFLASSGTLGADVSYLLALVFTVLFLIAWGFAKKAQGTRHHKLILVSMVSMVVYFCAYYYARQLGVLSFEGEEGFGGPREVYDSVFVPVLTTHLILVTLGLIMAFYMLVEGFRASEKVNDDFVLKTGELKVRAKTFKIVMFTILGLWAANQLFLTTVRHASIGARIAWAMIFGTVALVVSLEKLIEKLLPDGARRHRIMGRGTMIIYGLLLITSTATYLMLYVIYPAK